VILTAAIHSVPIVSDNVEAVEATARSSRDATRRIQAHIRRTPLVFSQAFSDRIGAQVWFKLENRQTTGSFKLRGATNRLMTLSDEQRGNGCVAASSGNHGAAVACAMQEQGVSGIIFVPEQTSPVKVAAIRGYGGDVRFFGTDGLDTEEHARQFAVEHGMTYLSPYNDAAVIAGQGSCGVEILDDLADVDAVFVAVGGGGLVSGVGSVLKAHNPETRIVACQPAASAVMARSIEAGRILEMPSQETLSDGTAGGIEAGAITFPLTQAIVDEFVIVDEDEIASAMREYMDAEDERIEGAAGVAIAALVRSGDAVRGGTVVVIICGGNISDEKLQSVESGLS